MIYLNRAHQDGREQDHEEDQKREEKLVNRGEGKKTPAKKTTSSHR